jgi:hypothetical protein
MHRFLTYAVLLGLLIGLTPRPTYAQSTGFPAFLLGASYQGPPDRAWQTWDDGMFDPALVAADFDKAKAANLNVLRIFVQRALADDILASKWDKLDAVLDIADERSIQLILTLADYVEHDVSELAKLDFAIAQRYKGRATILAFDLKNEPRFADIALSVYPGEAPPLQRRAALGPFRVVVPQGSIREYRQSTQGQNEVPERLNDDQAFVYVNLLGAYLRMLDEGRSWARANDSSVVRYVQSPAAAEWEPLRRALDDTLAAWMAPRLAAIRGADPDRYVTVAHVDPVLAVLPANGKLDYRTFHRYPGATSAAIRSTLDLFDDIRNASPAQPLVLGEFGYSNASVDEDASAALEQEVVQGVRDRGGAGAIKWMLNDIAFGSSDTENAYGIYRRDGTAKPVVAAFQSLGTIRPADRAPAIARIDTPSGTTVATTVNTPTSPAPPLPVTAGPSRCTDPSLVSRLGSGVIAHLRIANTDGEGVYLRRSRLYDDRWVPWVEGTRMEVIGPDSVADGWRWKNVRDPCGREGFVPTRYTVPSS